MLCVRFTRCFMGHKDDEVLAKIPKGSSAQHDFGGETSEGSREEVQGTSVKEDSFDQSLV